MLDFYTTILRKSGAHWVAMCLENGVVGQADSKEAAITKVRQAIASFEEARKDDPAIYSAPLSIKDLHEFLTVEGTEPVSGPLEMRALYA